MSAERFYTVSKADASYFSGASAVVSATLPSGGTVKVDAYGPRSTFGEMTGPTVNWASIGSVSTEDAVAYAALIAYAAELADTLSGPEVER